MTHPDPRPFNELSDEGMLWFINRSVFHPLGFALAIHKEDDGTVSGWSMLGDGSEVWTFTEEADDEEFVKAQRFLKSLWATGRGPAKEHL